MYRYGVVYTTQKGMRGNAVIESKSSLSANEIQESINLDIAKHQDSIREIHVKNLSAGASLASKILITAAKIFK
jgi:hypothetical protein